MPGADTSGGFWDLSPEERDAELFEQTAFDPGSWFDAAETLTAATEALLPAAKAYEDCFLDVAEDFATSGRKSAVLSIEHPPDVRAIILVLAAYAAENLCKGHLVATRRMEVTRSAKQGRLPDWLKGHNLPKLLEEVGFKTQEEDRILANRLSRAAIWSARYPVPLSPQKLRDNLDGSRAGAWAVFTSADADLVMDFLSRLQSYCRNEPKR